MSTPKEDINKEIDWILNESKPLTIREWEGMHIDAEFPSVGIPIDKEQTQELAKSVLKLSSEIRRLRHKCNEEVWVSTWETEEDSFAIAKAYASRDHELFNKDSEK